jgi:hypothetical protein
MKLMGEAVEHSGPTHFDCFLEGGFDTTKIV